MTRSRTYQSFEAYLTFKWRLSTQSVPLLLCICWPSRPQIHNSTWNLMYSRQSQTSFWPTRKSPFPLFPYSSKHSHFVCHFGETPKGVTSHVHYYSIPPLRHTEPSNEGFQPHRASKFGCPALVYDKIHDHAFILPYSSKCSHFVCHFGEIPKGVTSHVHYYSIPLWGILDLQWRLSTSQGIKVQMSSTVVYNEFTIVAFILPYSSKYSHFVCHFGEIPKGVTSHVHYYSTHQLLTLPLLLLVQWFQGVSGSIVSHLFQSGSLSFFPGVLAYPCECDQATFDWSFEPGHISIDKTGLWHPSVLLKWAEMSDLLTGLLFSTQQHLSWNELWTTLQESQHS